MLSSRYDSNQSQSINRLAEDGPRKGLKTGTISKAPNVILPVTPTRRSVAPAPRFRGGRGRRGAAAAATGQRAARLAAQRAAQPAGQPVRCVAAASSRRGCVQFVEELEDKSRKDGQSVTST